MNETTEEIVDGIWANLPLKEKVDILEKAGWEIKSEEDLSREIVT